jgi:hypothetical protein
MDVTAYSGTSPTLQLTYERKGEDGIYYTMWTGSSITGVDTDSTSLGPGLETDHLPGKTGRIVWTIGGTTPSFTFSISVTGR